MCAYLQNSENDFQFMETYITNTGIQVSVYIKQDSEIALHYFSW